MDTIDIPGTNTPDERLLEASQLLALSPKMSEIIVLDLNPSNPKDGYVAVYLEPIKFYTIGKDSKQARVRVGTGKIVYAPRQGPEDRERFPEVFLEGETVGLESFGEDQCVVHEFSVNAGRFLVKVRKPLVGISITQSDVASISMAFYLRIQDPEKHLSMCTDPVSDQGLKSFRESIARFIAGNVRATFQEDIQLWSMPHVGDVAKTVFARLDDKLNEDWGMRLRKSVIPERRYPERLNELAMDFRSAEQEFLNLDQIGREELRDRWGFEPIDITEMQSISEKRGRGAGLLWVARRHQLEIQPFLEWLAAKRNPAIAASEFLEEIYLKKPPLQRDDVELSEQILFSAVRNPVLGLGEWADTEMVRPEKSEYRILEGFLQASPTPELERKATT